MYSHFLKRNGAPLTDNEKSMIINIHNYLLGDSSTSNDHHKLTLCKHIAEILGVAEELLHTKILDANKKAEQLSTVILRQYLLEQGYNFSKWKLLRVLHRLGYYFGQGERRNILHESPNNVAYRCRYLRFRFANLEGKNDVPRRVVLAPGHGPLVVIFGAIIVFRNGSSNKLHGELVPNSVHIWDPTIKPSGNWGRKRNNADEWDNIPDVVKDANIMPNQVDYHGNFNAEIFEDLFSTLCKALYEKYGPVNIHMDGASYHKWRVENIPTSNTKKQEIIDWLNAHNIVFSDELRKPELLELVQMNKEKVTFACVKIAKQYEHEVSFTPPYHCELQPIEGIWSVVKGEVAHSGPHPNLLSVQNTLLNAFKKKITSQVIIGFWRRALKNAKEYLEFDDNAQLMDEDFDEYDKSDEDCVI
ncbi:unnamed protein product [Rhizophagus irregularis]|nr:unnamed protein product [Rhizophagus irregularis]